MLLLQPHFKYSLYLVVKVSKQYYDSKGMNKFRSEIIYLVGDQFRWLSNIAQTSKLIYWNWFIFWGASKKVM